MVSSFTEKWSKLILIGFVLYLEETTISMPNPISINPKCPRFGVSSSSISESDYATVANIFARMTYSASTTASLISYSSDSSSYYLQCWCFWAFSKENTTTLPRLYSFSIENVIWSSDTASLVLSCEAFSKISLS